MTKQVRPLTRPLQRRIGKLVVEINETGVRIRGNRKRKWKSYTWIQVLCLASPEDRTYLLEAAEEKEGGRTYEAITAPARNPCRAHA